MKLICILLPALLLAACGGPTKALEVRQLHLRTEVIPIGEDPMAVMEKQRRLHGAISAADRRERLGQYFTLDWKDPAGAGKGGMQMAV